MNSQPSNSQNLTGEQLYNLLPWWWRLTYCAITLSLLLPGLLYALLAFINPFWFRMAMLESAVEFLESLDRIRFKLMKPALRKYSLFETLKQGKNVI